MSITTSENSKYTNRLAQETSPYLLQHAHNPVDWFPWGPEALEHARTKDKPIFLSVGYSACHWCHVMERESFEDAEIARLLNEHFVSVKVDREERPDIDEIYMTAVQMMTGHGGWPMTVFMMPDGRPFFGGTYFPPDNRGGRIGFRSLVTQLADAYRTRRPELEEVANSIVADLEKTTRQKPLSAPSGPFDAVALLQSAITDMVSRFDAKNGGFGNAPKFPPHHALRLLLHAIERDVENAVPLLVTTLDKMALGGIYDHIGGGFHRYSTDAVWLLPHFEKMLYDNALLARVYAGAFVQTGREAYARIARETCDWVLRDLSDPAGRNDHQMSFRPSGFHAALDADSEGEEGKYYVWTQAEINTVLGNEAGAAFGQRYNFSPSGNFREEATGHATGTNIPCLAIGDENAVLPDALDTNLTLARAALLRHRYERVAPGKDDKVITSWNGLMIGALAFAGQVLNEERYLAAARRAANFCLTTLRPDGHLLRRYARGQAGLPAFLDDHAYLADGLLDLYDATGEAQWADEARSLADHLLAKFWDNEDNGFFFAGTEHETLIARSKDLFDGALPSANGVAARVLARLSHLPGGSRYGDAARALLLTYRGVLHRAPNGTQTLVEAALKLFGATDTETAFVPVTLSGPETLTLTPGTTTEVVFSLRIQSGYHVNARTPGKPHLIPTIATVATDAPITFGPLSYPDAVTEEIAGDALPIYKGPVTFTLPVTVPAETLSGHFMLALSVRYQPCSETACLPPDTQVHSLTLRIGSETPTP